MAPEEIAEIRPVLMKVLEELGAPAAMPDVNGPAWDSFI